MSVGGFRIILKSNLGETNVNEKDLIVIIFMVLIIDSCFNGLYYELSPKKSPKRAFIYATQQFWYRYQSYASQRSSSKYCTYLLIVRNVQLLLPSTPLIPLIPFWLFTLLKNASTGLILTLARSAVVKINIFSIKHNSFSGFKLEWYRLILLKLSTLNLTLIPQD